MRVRSSARKWPSVRQYDAATSTGTLYSRLKLFIGREIRWENSLGNNCSPTRAEMPENEHFRRRKLRTRFSVTHQRVLTAATESSVCVMRTSSVFH